MLQSKEILKSQKTNDITKMNGNKRKKRKKGKGKKEKKGKKGKERKKKKEKERKIKKKRIYEHSEKGPLHISYGIANLLPVDKKEKQELLQANSTTSRLEMSKNILLGLIAKAKEEKKSDQDLISIAKAIKNENKDAIPQTENITPVDQINKIKKKKKFFFF